ncbi:GntR family transcriptional regulator [Streptomyces sp. 4N509B]|uniref:GntR family transcriptional regulator n=1 Tax=Streptomyces sp. 4N509B TaxID=3457413 RepID=UPI003FD4C875
MATTVDEQIREAIIAGRLLPGSALGEKALATQFGTSRTPVREAPHRLEIERLNSHLFLASQTMLGVEDRWQTALREHDELIAAIESRDGDAARRIAEHHMLGARDVRMRLYAEADDGRR